MATADFQKSGEVARRQHGVARHFFIAHRIYEAWRVSVSRFSTFHMEGSHRAVRFAGPCKTSTTSLYECAEVSL